MTVHEIIKQHLSEKGLDGLFNSWNGCACLAGDLAPCGEPQMECEAGLRAPCDGTCDEGKCDFHIVAGCHVRLMHEEEEKGAFIGADRDVAINAALAFLRNIVPYSWSHAFVHEGWWLEINGARQRYDNKTGAFELATGPGGT